VDIIPDTALQVFTNPQFGEIRVVGEMFVAQDVAQALGYYDTYTMTRRLDDDEKGTQSLRTPGGEQDMTVINESGLYNAILGSKLKTAKTFKRWVTGEVLPTIRKHGVFATPDAIERTLNDPDYIIGILNKIKEERQRRIEAEAQIAVLAPKAAFYDDVSGSKDAIAIGEVAKVLGISGLGRNNLFSRLRELRILQRDNLPYQDYVDRGYFRVIEQKWTTPNGETRISFKTLVYQKGLDYIRRKLGEAF